MQGRTARNAKIQFYTPNKEIMKFPYGDEVVREECHKRGIDVHFGQELIEMKTGPHGEKIGVFKNVDTGDTYEREFFSAVINPPSKPFSELVDSGIA